MAVVVQLPGYLSALAEGRGRVVLAVVPATVGDALTALFAAHPALRDRVTDERGRVRRHVNVFVGGESIRYTGDLATPLKDGAEVTILPAISGG
jgi:molybdopterin converting factor small subunit